MAEALVKKRCANIKQEAMLSRSKFDELRKQLVSTIDIDESQMEKWDKCPVFRSIPIIVIANDQIIDVEMVEMVPLDELLEEYIDV